MTHPAYEDCHTCLVYGHRRMSVIIPEMHRVRLRTGESPQQILDRFMSGVHDRHLSGLPILPERAA